MSIKEMAVIVALGIVSFCIGMYLYNKNIIPRTLLGGA